MSQDDSPHPRLDFSKIEAASNLTFGVQARSDILDACRELTRNRDINAAIPLSKDFKRLWSEVGDAAETLANLLVSNEGAQVGITNKFVRLCRPNRVMLGGVEVDHPFATGVDREAFLRVLAGLQDEAARQKELEIRRGRKSDWPTDSFIETMSSIYDAAGGTGRGAYVDSEAQEGGRLFKMMEETLRQILGADDVAFRSLNRRIQDYRRDQKKID